jgi:integrase/recombinase XerC
MDDYTKIAPPLNNSTVTIRQAIEKYLQSVAESRNPKTATAYGYALKAFELVLKEYNFDPEKVPTSTLPENSIAWFAAYLKVFTPATERLYLTAANNFFQFLAAEGIGSPNLPRVENLKRKRMRRVGQRLPQFPRAAIEQMIDYAQSLINLTTKSDEERLINLRDRAFLITLADTGLRVHEACGLHRGDMDWSEGRALIIGKGDQQAVVRFSKRSMEVIKDYLSARLTLIDGAAGRPLASLPLFARHDRGAGKKVKPITTTTGRNIVADRVKEALGEDAVGTITPHSFRHYFVTTVLRASGNLKMAQELARHKNISVTTRYAHLSDDELDKGYWDIFNAKREG